MNQRARASVQKSRDHKVIKKGLIPTEIVTRQSVFAVLLNIIAPVLLLVNFPFTPAAFGFYLWSTPSTFK